MKKTAFTLLAIAIMAFMAYNVFAQDNNPGTNPNDNNMRPGPMGMGKMMRNRGPEMAQDQMNPGPMGQMMAGGKGPGMFRPEIMEKIGLTKEQKDTIQSIHSSHRKDMIRNNADLQLAEVDLQDMLRKDKPEMDLVKGQIQKIASLKGNIEFAKIKMQIDLKGVLTDEQKAKLEKIMQDQKATMKNNNQQGRRNGANTNKPGPMNQMNRQNRPMNQNQPNNQPNPNNDQQR
jgi:Spy/CpxP family protein refolding chaperone